MSRECERQRDWEREGEKKKWTKAETEMFNAGFARRLLLGGQGCRVAAQSRPAQVSYAPAKADKYLFACACVCVTACLCMCVCVCVC